MTPTDRNAEARKQGRWSKAEIKVLRRLCSEGLSYRQIGLQLGRSYPSCADKGKRLGLEASGQRIDAWPAAQIEKMRVMVADGFSASQISGALGISKNAIIGKVHRLGLQLKGVSSWSSANRERSQATRRAKPVYVAQNAIANARKRARKPLGEAGAIIAFPADESPSTARIWTERLAGQCDYPVSGERADTFSCCAPVQFGSHYCPSHHELCYYEGLDARKLSRSLRRFGG